MTIGVVIATHGLSSVELLKSAEMILGKQENVETVTFNKDEGLEELQKKYSESLAKLSDNEDILILVDILGGSPFNVGIQQDYEVITGVNIPILLELFINRKTMELDELINHLINSGKESIIRLSQLEIIKDDEEF